MTTPITTRRGVVALAVLLAAFSGCAPLPPGSEPPPQSAATPAAAAPAAAAPAATATAGRAASRSTAAPAPSATPLPALLSREPAPFALTLTPVFSGLTKPLFVTHAPDGSGRLFVVEKGGTIRVAVDGQLLPAPFLDITPLVNSSEIEQGLLGMAFHPRYATNGDFFVAYTAQDGANTVARYEVSADRDRAEPTSARVLLALPDRAANHNGGMLAFGPDGYLYVGTGDEGGGNDVFGNGENLGSLFGKLLRIDVDAGDPYAIPRTNPFVGRSDVRPEIWAYGLRNPWRYSFDRASGDLWIGDPGQAAFEEVNLQRAGSRGGENYGWSRTEALHCHPYTPGPCDQSGITLPILEYGRDELDFSVIGGHVYRGTAHPDLQGAYVFGDYVSGRIWSLRQDASGRWVRTELLDTALNISSFGEDQAGELYLSDLGGGGVYRLVVAPRR